MLRFHRTSLLSSNAQTLVNTVNTVGVMGKGIAAEFKKRFPEMFSVYKAKCDAKELHPGSIWLWQSPERWVLNFATKAHWRAPSKMSYIETGLHNFRNDYHRLGIREIAFPRLGCGNGGLDWNHVRPMMVHYLSDLPIKVFIHDFEYPIGKPEHYVGFFVQKIPQNFESFLNDIKDICNNSSGAIKALSLGDVFSARLDEDSRIILESESRKSIVEKDDLYSIWIALLSAPVTRSELPDAVNRDALKIMSILADLPYIRAVNVRQTGMPPSLAIEMVRNSDPIAITENT